MPETIEVVEVNLRKPLHTQITMGISAFCSATDLGQTTVRQMLRDGRLKGHRVGRKRLLIVVKSYLDLIAKQEAEGVPEYDRTGPAVEARKAKRIEKAKTKSEVDLADLGLL